jgi:hypothetical protein
MTELDELKDAMQSPPDYEPAPLDLGSVMAAGGRLRRRRRFAVGGASAAAVVVLLVGGNQLINGGPVAPINAAASAPSGAVPSGAVLSAINSGAPGILGKVAETGKRIEGRRWILYVETVDPDKLDENLVLVLGRTKTGYINDFTRDVVTNDFTPGRMSRGFHAAQAGMVVNGRTTPTFGYYVGGATRITARDRATGRTVQAHLAEWSGFGPKDKAQIFWFDFTQGRDAASLTDLTAYGRDGTKLPAGRNEIGAG